MISNYIKPGLHTYETKNCLFTNAKITYQVSMLNKLCFLFNKLFP